MQGIRVPRKIVQEMLKDLDPDGTAERKSHRLQRRTYTITEDQTMFGIVMAMIYELKPFGFPIHGCIDGWSRKMLWLHVTRSNNSPHNIADYYLDAVQPRTQALYSALANSLEERPWFRLVTWSPKLLCIGGGVVQRNSTYLTYFCLRN